MTNCTEGKKSSGSGSTIKLSAKCLYCVTTPTIISGSPGVSSNFITHLKRKHQPEYENYIKRKKSEVICNKKLSKQQLFKKDIVEFVVQTTTPLSIVDNVYFRNLFKSRISLQVPSRRVISGNLKDHLSATKGNIKDLIAKNNFFCTTADIWSNKHKSFFGYTCHWLDAEFNRVSAALACKRFNGSHTYDRIAEFIREINEEYGLNTQNIVATVTDNGSNFVKAFREFGVNPSDLNEIDIGAVTGSDENCSGSDSEYGCDDDEDKDENDNDDNDEEEIEFVEIEYSTSTSLPKHYRCGSHTISLITTTDFNTAIRSDRGVYVIHLQAFSKCNILWKKANRPKSSEIINDILGSSLKTPCVTRWNSLYDATQQILQKSLLLNDLCAELKITKFTATDITYLKEYCEIMKPFAEILDFLQGETEIYYGMMIPSLVTLKVKTDKIIANELSYLEKTLKAIQESLFYRFKQFFNLEEESYDAIVAAMSHPNIKLKWLKALSNQSKYSKDDLETIFIQYCRRYKLCVPRNIGDTNAVNSTTIFDFGQENAEDHIEFTLEEDDCVKIELQLYLRDTDSSLKSLRNYPTISKVFERSNTPLTSSGAVERLFSFAGIVSTPRRQRLSDANFETLVLLKANKRFLNVLNV